MTLKGALVGCGYISTAQLDAWKKIPDVEMVAVCDLDIDKAKAQAEKFEIPNFYRDFLEMLENEQLHFVDIATQPHSHFALVSQAAERGLHVLCQKPLTDSMPEAQKMVDFCRQEEVVFMVNENFRHQAWFRKMKELIINGDIGQPLYANFDARWRSTLPQPDFEGQDFFAHMPHLIVYEMGVHYFDTARFLFGEADHLFSVIRRISPHIVGDDFSVITVQFGELICVFDMNWFSVVEPRGRVTAGQIRIEGTEGTILLDSEGQLCLYQESQTRRWAFGHDVVPESFTAAQRHFIESIVDGSEPETSGSETLKTLELLAASYLSATEDRVVHFSEDLSGINLQDIRVTE